MEPITSDAVVSLIISHWRGRLAEFPSYLQTQFHYSLKSSPVSDRLVIFQMADGDMATQNMGRNALRKWVYEGDCLHPVPFGHAWQETYQTDRADELYLTPVFVFFFDDHQLLLSERFGPTLTHRLSGRLRDEGNQLVVDWTTVWCSTAT